MSTIFHLACAILPMLNSVRPFVLLTGTVVLLILLVGGSVALLTTIGANDLPSTLTGGVAGGSKRD